MLRQPLQGRGWRFRRGITGSAGEQQQPAALPHESREMQQLARPDPHAAHGQQVESALQIRPRAQHLEAPGRDRAVPESQSLDRLAQKHPLALARLDHQQGSGAQRQTERNGGRSAPGTDVDDGSGGAGNAPRRGERFDHEAVEAMVAGVQRREVQPRIPALQQLDIGGQPIGQRRLQLQAGPLGPLAEAGRKRCVVQRHVWMPARAAHVLAGRGPDGAAGPPEPAPRPT